MTLSFPDTGLVDSYSIYRKQTPSVTFIVQRDVVSPVLFRNTETDRAETQEFNGTLRAQVNGEKFVSKERRTGLDLLRNLDDDHDLIHPEYTYNEPSGIETSVNFDTVTYGIAGTDDQEYGLKSRVYEGYTFTTAEYDLMNRETRNAVFESGTMQDEEGEQSQALFEHVNIQPGNSFIHFVTLEAGTPGMFLYVLHNLLTTDTYGARETRSGKTLENSVIGLILDEHSTMLSTGELLMNYYPDGDDVVDAVDAYLQDTARGSWEIYGDALANAPDFPDWYQEIEAVAGRTHDDAKSVLRDRLVAETEEARDVLTALS